MNNNGNLFDFYKDTLDNKILNICRYEYEFFLKKKNVFGVGLGYKEKKNIKLSQKCIKVYVTKKYSTDRLDSCDIVPPFYKDIETDVIEGGFLQPTTLTDRVRPVPGGYNLGLGFNINGGTFGCIVKDNSNNYYILSCNHVLAKNYLPADTPIIQPSYFNGGRMPNDLVANLSRYINIHLITPEATPVNHVDCAIAQIFDLNVVSPTITYLGIPKGTDIPILEEIVYKVGAYSELTSGVIQSIGTTIEVGIFEGDALFVNQIITNAMCVFGDSGAVLMNYGRNVIGLAISSSDTISVYNSISDVLQSLNVSLVTA